MTPPSPIVPDADCHVDIRLFFKLTRDQHCRLQDTAKRNNETVESMIERAFAIGCEWEEGQDFADACVNGVIRDTEEMLAECAEIHASMIYGGECNLCGRNITTRRRGRRPTRPATLAGVSPGSPLYLEKVKELNLCMGCERSQREPGRSRCAPCQEYQRGLSRRKGEKRVAEGKCALCGQFIGKGQGAWRCENCRVTRKIASSTTR